MSVQAIEFGRRKVRPYAPGPRELPAAPRAPLFNFSTKKVGGLRFVKLGRLTVSFCVSREFKPL